MKLTGKELRKALEKAHSGVCKASHKWNDYFDNEEELIQAMLNEKVKADDRKYPVRSLVKGYKYVAGFRAYYKKNGYLTDKQMTQLKRLAIEIAYNLYCV